MMNENGGTDGRYTLSEILSTVSPDYFKVLGKRIRQFSLVLRSHTDQPENPEHIAKILADERNVKLLISSLSGRARSLANWIGNNRTSVDLDILERIFPVDYLHPDLEECYSKMILFPVPDGKKAVSVAMPVDYLFCTSAGIRIHSSTSLVNALLRYGPPALAGIVRKADSHRGRPDRTEIYLSIIGSWKESVSSLTGIETECFRYALANFGVLTVEQIEKKFGPILKRVYYSSLTIGEIFEGPQSANSGHPAITMIVKGLFIPVFTEYSDAIYGIAVPDEIYLGQIKKDLDDKAARLFGEVDRSDFDAKLMISRWPSIFADFRKIMLAIHGLSARRKNTSEQAVQGITHLPGEVVSEIIESGKNSGWITGNIVNLQISSRGKEMLENPEKMAAMISGMLGTFPFRVRNHMMQEDKLNSIVGHMFVEQLGATNKPVRLRVFSSLIVNEPAFLTAYRNYLAASAYGSYHSYSDSSEKERGKKVFTDIAGYVEDVLVPMSGRLFVYGLLSAGSQTITGDTHVQAGEIMKKAIAKEEIRIPGNQGGKSGAPSILPNLELLADISTSFTIFDNVCRFSDIESADQMCRFRISYESITRWMNDSHTIEELKVFLRKSGVHDLPGTFTSLLESMENRRDEIEIIPCDAVIRTKDPSIMEELVRKKQMSRFIGSRISDDSITIPQGSDLDRVVRQLKNSGYVIRKGNRPEKK